MATNNIAARLLSDLKRDFGLTDAQAAGVVGNLMYESGGFNSLQEIQPTVPGSRGGYGYAQWTGPRRNAFESYAKSNNLDPSSYEANYGFLKHEIETNPYERRQFNTVKKARTAEEAARLVSENFLRPGVPNVPARQQLAAQAMGYSKMPIPPAEIPNVVASRTDTVPQTRNVAFPRPRPAMGSDPGTPAPMTLLGRYDPAQGRVVDVPQTRDVPLPRLDPRQPNRMDLAAPELPQVRLPPIPPADPLRAYNQARYASTPAVPPPVVPRDPMAEFNRLRGNPDIVTPSLAARLRPPVVYQPTLGYVKDQSRLMPNPIPMAPQVVRVMPPLPRPRPNNQPMRIAPMPAPLSQRPPPSLRIAVNGAGSYTAPTQQAPWAPQGYTNDGSGRITSNETGGVYYERHLR